MQDEESNIAEIMGCPRCLSPRSNEQLAVMFSRFTSPTLRVESNSNVCDVSESYEAGKQPLSIPISLEICAPHTICIPNSEFLSVLPNAATAAAHDEVASMLRG